MADAHQRRAAEILGINPSTLAARMRSFGHQAPPQLIPNPAADHFAGRKSVNFWPCGAIMKTSNFAGAVALAFFETM